MNVYRPLVFTLSALCCALASESRSADPSARQPLRPLPLFPGDGPPLAMVMRGQLTWLGDFDKDGNFIRHPRCPANLGANGGSLLPRFIRCIDIQSFVYEHRSGRLIKGTMVAGGKVANFFCIVVPELGSTVLNIKDIDLKKPDPDRRVWNMPEYMPAYEAARIRKYGDKPAPKAPEPPKAGTPVGWELIPFSKLDTDLFGRKIQQVKPPKYARVIGDDVEFGHLSDEGEFFPDPDLPSISRAGIRTPIKDDPFGVPRYYTVPHPPWDRGPKQEGQKESDPEPVYEFRSGRLIKGMLQATGNFVPELGSKVTDFKDYDPNERRRIYNLPGVLRPVEKK